MTTPLYRAWLPGFLPKLPNRLRGAHWTSFARVRTQAGLHLVAHGLPFPRLDSPVRVVLTRCSPRKCDLDNVAASAKPVVDAIVAAGIIPDDSPRWIPRSPEGKWEKTPKASGGTLIELWSAA